jgi:hypothetical protein
MLGIWRVVTVFAASRQLTPPWLQTHYTVFVNIHFSIILLSTRGFHERCLPASLSHSFYSRGKLTIIRQIRPFFFFFFFFSKYNFVSVWQLWVSWFWAPSLTRGWVCNVLVQIASVHCRAVTLRFKSHRTQTIFCCLIWDSPNIQDEVPISISPKNRVAQLCLRPLGSLFIASYDSQGYDGGILTRFNTGLSSKLLYDWRPVNQYIEVSKTKLLYKSSLYSHGTDRTRNVFFFNYCLLSRCRGKTFPQSCSLTMIFTVACLHNCPFSVGLHVTLSKNITLQKRELSTLHCVGDCILRS